MRCYICNTEQDCRPYGERGQMICFPCMKAEPEREAEATRQFAAQFTAAGPEVVLGDEAGPYPAQHAIQEHPND